jgi:hypothetical protein
MKRLALIALAAGCTAADAPDDCREDRCESVGSREELLASLDGFADPVATWLRAAATERGTLEGDYRMVLDGVGAELGCDAETESSFVVLSNDQFIPKPILTRCANDANAASRFLVAMVGDATALDRRQIHVAAWDDDAGVYRRYATSATDDGELAINVQPQFCLGCHGGPEKLGTWVPLMNEMTSPWAGWNAHPGFTSQMFDEFFPAAYASDPTYQEVTRTLDSAAAFEPIVRAGIARVTGARLKQRTAAPDLQLAFELVRPLFCDESVNYVSEVHGSGELRSHALVDDALRNLYRTAGIEGDWSWLADTTIYLEPGAPLTLIPVRGESTIAAELGLVARGVLPARDAIRVRALDWKRPVQSDFRCGLYRAAVARGLELGDAQTTADLVPRIVDAILTFDGRPLRASSPDTLLVVEDPSALAGDWSSLEATLVDFGARIETHLASASRSVLAGERNRRACQAVATHPTAPIFPDVSCP